jgi:hypothetical protein
MLSYLKILNTPSKKAGSSKVSSKHTSSSFIKVIGTDALIEHVTIPPPISTPPPTATITDVTLHFPYWMLPMAPTKVAYHQIETLGLLDPLTITGTTASDPSVTHTWYIQIFDSDPLASGKTIDEIATFMETNHIVSGTSDSVTISHSSGRRYHPTLDGTSEILNPYLPTSVVTYVVAGYYNVDFFIVVKDSLGQIGYASQQLLFKTQMLGDSTGGGPSGDPPLTLWGGIHPWP